MQINPHSPALKEFFKYAGWILLLLFLFLKDCSGNKESVSTVTVTTPAINGSFWTQKPKHTPIVTNANNQVNVQKGTNTIIENPIDAQLLAENEKLKQDYDNANDSIRELQYSKAIQLKSFSSIFENDVIKIDFNGIVQGEVKGVTPTYTIKERKVDVPVKTKETVFRLLAGMEVGNNTILNDFKAKANIMIQNKKGNALTASFDTNQTIWVGYNFSILNIKR